MKNELKKALIPLYQQLTDKVSNTDQENYSAFCIQWGKEFPVKPNEGLLFVGRATNGWHYSGLDTNKIFSEDAGRIFGRDDQMQWVESTNYYKKSAFWRVIKTLAMQNHSTAWYDHVAWSNLCKIAPESQGNPSNEMFYNHLELNCKILETEINILSPKVVIMLTKMNWAKDYLKYLNQGDEPKLVATLSWGSYQAQLYAIGEYYIIISEHPMCKAEACHVEAIQTLINIARK